MQSTGKQILSPRNLAQAIGVSESSIKRWVDHGLIRATRTAGRHRRIPFAEAVRFIRETRSIVVEPGILGLPELAMLGEALTASAEDEERLYDGLVAGAEEESRAVILALYLEGRSVAEIADGPLSTVFGRIGELWKKKEEGIFLEHRATDIALRALQQLSLMIPTSPDRPAALGGAPPGDPYLLPTFLAATVLTSVGFQAVNLGPETPLRTLGHAARSLGPRLVWLSVGQRAKRSDLRPGLARLLEQLEAQDARLVIGGRGLEDLELSEHPRLVTATTMQELEEMGRALLGCDPSARDQGGQDGSAREGRGGPAGMGRAEFS